MSLVIEDMSVPSAMQVTKLCDFGSGDGADTVCSVAWSQRGTYLSVGTHSGEAQIWDVSKIKLCVPGVNALHLAVLCAWPVGLTETYLLTLLHSA